MLPDGTAIILRNIVYADFAAHCVNIHYTNSPDVKLRTAFRNVEATLCEYPGFFSPSKGIVINLNEVSAQKNDIFLMSDDTRIPISRRKAKEAADIYTSYCFEKLRKGGEC
jgi:DNA-binding LytR/AlgR family response regulator